MNSMMYYNIIDIGFGLIINDVYSILGKKYYYFVFY